MRSIGSGAVRLGIDGHRADVVLDRPEKRNAMNEAVLRDLVAALEEVREAGDVRAVTLLGEGPVFCAGMDLEMMREAAGAADSPATILREVTALLDDLAVPTVAGIKGAAIAGAFELVLPVDFRIIDREAAYGVPEVQLGTFPNGGATQRLPRLVGLSKAKELVLTGEYVDPEEARECGLVHEVVEDPSAVDDRARAWADDLVENAPLGMARAGKLLDSALDVPLEEGLAREAELGAELVDTDDYAEGFEARLAGREPEFVGE